MRDLFEVIESEEIVEEEEINNFEGDELITIHDTGLDFPFHVISVE